MTRETRIALLVGLAFIILFGLVLGRREPAPLPAASVDEAIPGTLPPPRIGPELAVAPIIDGGEDRPVLAPPRPRPRPVPAAPAAPETPQGPPGRTIVPQPPTPRPGQAPPALAGTIHTVQAGETLSRIARKYYRRQRGQDIRLIYQANRDRIRDADTLAVGQKLVIPALASAPMRPPPSPPGQRRPRRYYRELTLQALRKEFRRPTTYVVRRGDSLTDIARRTMGDARNETVRKLYEANRSRIRNPNSLPVGLRLRIPN